MRQTVFERHDLDAKPKVFYCSHSIEIVLVTRNQDCSVESLVYRVSEHLRSDCYVDTLFSFEPMGLMAVAAMKRLVSE